MKVAALEPGLFGKLPGVVGIRVSWQKILENDNGLETACRQVIFDDPFFRPNLDEFSCCPSSPSEWMARYEAMYT